MILEPKLYYQYTVESVTRIASALQFFAASAQGTDPLWIESKRLATQLREAILLDTNEQLWLDRQIVSFMDKEALEYFAGGGDEVAKDAYHYIRLFALACNVVITDAYTEEDMRQICSGKRADIDPERYIYSLRQSMFDKSAHTIVLNILLVMDMPQAYVDKPYAWDEMLSTVLLFNYVWYNFVHIPLEAQRMVLGAYVLRSVFVGVPVRDRLYDLLVLEAKNPIEYLRLHGEYTTALEAAFEPVPLDPEERQKKLLREVFVLIRQELQKANDSSAVDVGKIVTTTLSNHKNPTLFNALRDAASLYLHVSTATLVEEEKVLALDDVEQYNADLFHLVLATLDERRYWYIIKYFKDTKNVHVPLVGFLRSIREHEKLADEVAVNRILSLQDELMKKQLLAPDQVLVIFHEKDGTFHWNDALFS